MRVAEWQPEHDKGDESGMRPYFAPGNQFGIYFTISPFYNLLYLHKFFKTQMQL
jgi:hypothetical protein